MKNWIPITVVMAAGAVCLADQPRPQGIRLMEPFDYRGVTLNDDPLLHQVQQVRDYYLRVPNDDYLKGFRQSAGRPAPGVELGGWYSEGIFHVFGQVLSGLARMHAATGDEACREKLDALIYLDTMDINFEIHCGSWAAFKLARRLMCFTGDAGYGDWIERLLINGIGACIQSSPDGKVMYNAGYGLSGACKSHNMPPWACCAGTRIQAIADYHDLIFFKDSDSLYVNIFTPATVTWEHQGTKVSLRQDTRFPESDQATLYMALSADAEFAIKLRQPGWLAGPMQIAVNGQPVTADFDEKHWLVVRRKWQDGDQLSIRLPMRFSAERFPKASANTFPAAIVYGPVVMACRSPNGNPVSKIDFANLNGNFVPSPGEPLVYRFST